jgi:hypothetical protein
MVIIILGIVAVVLITLVLTRLFSGRNTQGSQDLLVVPDADCCGAHEVCDKETLLSENDEIVYYQDEELDDFRLKNPSSYTPAEIEQFREVLFTMRDDEVAGWLRSLQLRGIYPPHIVREEALMVVEEIRTSIRTQRGKAGS